MRIVNGVRVEAELDVSQPDSLGCSPSSLAPEHLLISSHYHSLICSSHARLDAASCNNDPKLLRLQMANLRMRLWPCSAS